MNKEELQKSKELAVESAIRWVITGKDYSSMKYDVNKYMEAYTANNNQGYNQEQILLDRNTIALEISLTIINVLGSKKEQLLYKELREIAYDIPSNR